MMGHPSSQRWMIRGGPIRVMRCLYAMMWIAVERYPVVCCSCAETNYYAGRIASRVRIEIYTGVICGAMKVGKLYL